MKKYFLLVGTPIVVGLLVLVSLARFGVNASGSKPSLPLSPISGSVLMAQAIHSGKVHVHPVAGHQSPNLGCSPAPCTIPNVQASEGGNPVNEDPIAVDPNNHKNLLSGGNDYNCPNLQGFYSSSNGGATWSTTCMNSLSGQFGEGDPGVGYDLNHNSYITGIDSPDGITGEIVFEKSSNNGATWSAPAVAVNPLFSGGLSDKSWLQIDDNASSPHANALYISTTQFDNTNGDSTIAVAHSDNGGSTWTDVQVDSTQPFPGLVDQFSDLAIGKDGTVYVSWQRCPTTGPTGDCGGTIATFYVSKSTNGGNTWSTPSVIETAGLAPDSCGAFYGCLPNTFERVSDIPVIGIDNSTGKFSGKLYVATYKWNGTQMVVQVANSRNGGRTWTPPERVTIAGDTHDQFFPWLTVSAAGYVGVSWLDRRNDPANINYQTFEAFSNGGGGFSQNVRVASAASNPFNDGFGSGFMGDYTGNIWVGNTLYASWMDSRNGSTMQDEVGGYKRII